MITDITKFVIVSNTYVTIHAVKEDKNGKKDTYRTEFECGFEKESKYKVEVLGNLEYNQETFDYIDGLDVEWSLLESD